jgi:regulator of ribonuclease activity A
VVIGTLTSCPPFDAYTAFQIAEPIFQSFGANPCFSGQISTVKVFEDNVIIRKLLEQKVSNRVLVIDGRKGRLLIVSYNHSE